MSTPAVPSRLRRVLPGIHGLRLATGLVLFAYVTLHLLNLSLGNVSIQAADAGLRWATRLWHSVPGTALLGGAFAVHMAFGLWALYERRHFQWRASEAVQLVSGLLIPALLINHIIVTRIAQLQFGLEKVYTQEFYILYRGLAGWGAVQVGVLCVAWLHGCLGLHFWLRLKPFYRRAAPWLLTAAGLLPVVALLGFFQGGRTALALAQDPAWRAAHLGVDRLGTPDMVATLVRLRYAFLAAYAAAILAVVAARGLRVLRERKSGLIRISYADGPSVRVPRGLSVLEASRLFRIRHAGVCGGRGRCSTCRIRVLDDTDGLDRPDPAEAAVLARIGAGQHVRLACQLRPQDDLSLVRLLPPGATAADGRRNRMRTGEERFAVLMFVDLRGSTRLAEHRLPFDTVFTINRFLSAVGRAVTAHGGQPNTILGDGMLVLFGLDGTEAEGCRQALEAAAAIGENVRTLNRSLALDNEAPLAFGIGLHAGTVIFGEVGFEAHAVVTALGDPVNTAARLQDTTKELGCEVVVSTIVCARAGLPPDALPVYGVQARGRSGTMEACAAGTAGLRALLDRNPARGARPAVAVQAVEAD